ncbi:MAG: hypothetical protein JW819_09525 [Candidatus Krumholzibacteriota bacterium]|nr:hypothetical protein [Candidatus Krumholzibacteriota bacterium]
MKYALGFLGLLAGKIIGEIVFDSRLLGWILGILLGIAAYWAPAFLKYRKSSPHQFLSFHGPNSPITRSKSRGQLRTAIAQLAEGGLLVDFDPHSKEATADATQWTALSGREKLTLCQILAQAIRVEGLDPGELALVDREENTLALYSCADDVFRSASE